MIFVSRRKIYSKFLNEERDVHDLYVSKYQTTQIRWKEMMGTGPSKYKGDKKQVNKLLG